MEIQSVDLREHGCPMALLLAKRACVALNKGEQITLLINDSSALSDIPSYLKNNGFIVKKKKIEGMVVLNATKI